MQWAAGGEGTCRGVLGKEGKFLPPQGVSQMVVGARLAFPNWWARVGTAQERVGAGGMEGWGAGTSPPPEAVNIC